MISIGTTHDNGGRLADYLVTSKPGERADLWQLRGFASDDIKDAFRSIHVMAAATRCEQPLFHTFVRNPEGEHLSRDQWERVANRIESKLGLTDQPRAIAFHRDETTGHEHMHIGWSRIDCDTMTARAMPFFKLRLKEVSRELETELGLTPVRNEREGPVMAPKRDEDEQARRLGVDIRDVRTTIRECWDRSDNGRSFAAALSAEGLILARGERRDFIAIDHQGGIHALGKRILGNTAGEVRARMADLVREELPTVEQGRDRIAQQKAAPEPSRTNSGQRAMEADFAKVAKENTVASCAVEPEMPAPALPTKREPELTESAAEIGKLYRLSSNAAEFVAALHREGVRLAVVTAAEARQNEELREDQIVSVTSRGEVCPLSQHVTGDSQDKVDRLLAAVDRRELSGIEETQKQIDIETRLHIQLSQVGVLNRQDEPAPIPENKQPQPNAPERRVWKLMQKDRAYRNEIERQIQQGRQQSRPHDNTGRSPGRDR